LSERIPRIGIVLGGGGIAGYAFHCAVLASLQHQTGFDPRTAEVIVGTSAGAISGAVLRGHVSADEMRDQLIDTALDPEKFETLKILSGRSPKAIPKVWAGPGAPVMAINELRRGRNLRVSALVGALLPQGRQNLSLVTEPLDALHGEKWPAEKLWIPATDLQSGRVVVFGRDDVPISVSRAVEASAALPALFAPVKVNNRSYIDGGLSSPFNADLLIGYGGVSKPLDLVIVLAPLSVDELRTNAPFSSIARSLPRRRLRSEVRRINDAGPATLVIQPGRAVARAMGLNPMDHRRIPAIVDRSEELVSRRAPTFGDSATEVLDRAARLLTPPADVAYPDV
jgi:NTE family protein